jgi:ribose transport system permease protein
MVASNNILDVKSNKYVFFTIFKNRYTLLILLNVVMLVYFSFNVPYFATTGNFLNILKQISEIGLISIALTLLLISGNMDLSVGSIVGVSGIVTAMCLSSGVPIFLAILAGLAVGTLAGFINGLLIGKLGIQAIVVTIGSLVMFRGICYILTGGRSISGFPKPFYTLGNGTILGVPISVIVLIIFFVAGYIIMEKTFVGRYLIAVGNNSKTAHYTGINISRVKIYLFAISGFVSALAGVFLISRLSSAPSILGSGYELDIITAALIGGISVYGGSGKLYGTFLGLLSIGILRNGLNLMGMSVIYQAIVLGVLLLVAVIRRGE